jgi:hypothetical protein
MESRSLSLAEVEDAAELMADASLTRTPTVREVNMGRSGSWGTRDRITERFPR